VAAYRRVTPAPLNAALDGYPMPSQPRWAAWRRRSGLGDLIPAAFADLLAAVVDFADPVLAVAVPTPHHWDEVTDLLVLRRRPADTAPGPDGWTSTRDVDLAGGRCGSTRTWPTPGPDPGRTGRRLACTGRTLCK
jgi:hypothetical protein